MHGSEENHIGVTEATAYVLEKSRRQSGLKPSCASSTRMGDIIGAGIFISPSTIFKHTQSVGLSLVVWVLGCCIAVIGCLIYVELGTKIRKSGSDFAYLTHAGWQPAAVTFLYVSCCLIYPSVLAIQMMTFGKYVVHGLTSSISLSSFQTSMLQRIVGFLALWIVFYINLFSLKKFASRFQIVTTMSKLLIISLIIVIGFYYLIFKKSTASFKEPFRNSTKDLGHIILAFYSSLYSYNGWDVLNIGIEEIKNPRRTLPIAGICGLALAGVVFNLVNIAYFSVLTVDELKSSEAVAVDFAQKTLGDFSYIVPFLIAVLLLGNLNCTIFGCSRYVLAGARKHYLPSFLRLIHLRSMSPRAAVMTQVFVAMALSFIGNLEEVVCYMTFAMWVQRCIVQVALFWMRYKGFPYPEDAFTVPIFLPFVFFFICLALLIIPIVQNFHIAIYGTSLIIVGFTVYYLFIYRKHTSRTLLQIDNAFTVTMQLLFNLEFDEIEKAK